MRMERVTKKASPPPVAYLTLPNWPGFLLSDHPHHPGLHVMLATKVGSFFRLNT